MRAMTLQHFTHPGPPPPVSKFTRQASGVDVEVELEHTPVNQQRLIRVRTERGRNYSFLLSLGRPLLILLIKKLC
jgi:hypothetical protein